MIDFLVRPTIDEKGNYFPAIGVINDDDYKDKQPRDAEKIIFVLKASAKLNSEIHSICFSEIMTGKVRFLIKDQDAKQKLMGTEKGKKMLPEERIARLMPYEMTTRLFDEMCNLRAKPEAAGVSLERINTRMGKDKFSACEYGIWRIKALEEAHFKKMRNGRNRNLSDMIMFTQRR